MERRVINPWTWQDAFGYVQANLVERPSRVLICAGQTAVDENGQPQHVDDMRGQIGLALDNLETVLREAGFTFADVMRLNIYTTNVDQFFEHYDVVAARLGEGGARFAGSMLGVNRLAFPELLVEFEATAVS